MKSWLIVIYRIFSRDFLFSIFIFFFATFDIYEYFLFFFIEKMCNIIRLVFDTFFPEIPYLCDETPPSRKRNNCDFFNWKKKFLFSTHFRYIDLKEKKSSIDLLWYFDEQQRMKIIYGLIETIEIITKLIRFIKIMKI